MPDFDGTGPRGNGPFNGRGHGLCVSGLGRVLKNTSHGVKLLSLIAPAVTAIVLDALNPDGITRRLVQSARDRLGAGRTRNLTDVSKKKMNICQHKTDS